MALVTSTILAKQYDRDILEMFFNRYGKRKNEYTLIAKVDKAPPGKTYRSAEISGLGSAAEVPEGAGVPFDFPEEGNDKSVTYIQNGLGFQLTEIAREDLIQEPVKKMSETLADSMGYKTEVDFFKLFNLGATAIASGGESAHDGHPIFYDSHVTLKSGTTIDNKATAALSETGLQAAFEYFDNLVNESGFPIPDMGLDWLIVPSGLRWTAMRLLKQMGGVTVSTADLPNMSGNDMTTNPENGYVGAWKLHVSRFITDADAWYAISNQHQLKLLWKRNTRMEAGDDFHTGNRLYKATNRYRAFCLDYKPVYGSIPT